MDTYSNSIDFSKTILILLVVLGHFLLGNINENLLREIIYYFHMPLFLGISGYLLKKEKLINRSFFEYISSYKLIIIAYFIAVFFYNFLLYYYKSNTFDILEQILYPYYHLWFVQSWLLMLVLTYFLVKFSIIRIFYTISILLTIFWVILIGTGSHFTIKEMYFLGDHRTYYMLSFFLTGFLLRNYKFYIKSKEFLSVISLISIYLILNNEIETFIWCLINYVIIFLVTNINISYNSSINKIVAKNTLFIYLWHILPIIFLKKNLEKNIITVEVYYVLNLIFLILMIYLIYFFSKKNITIIKYLGYRK